MYHLQNFKNRKDQIVKIGLIIPKEGKIGARKVHNKIGAKCRRNFLCLSWESSPPGFFLTELCLYLLFFLFLAGVV